MKTIILATLFVVTVCGAARATPISTLFSTGVDSFGNVLPDGKADSHYTLTYAPSGASSTLTVDTASANSYWPKVPARSAYISPTGGATSAPTGYYIYTTTFDLTGFDPKSASISGLISGDDAVYTSLNGSSYTLTGANWDQLSTFTLTSNFISGSNTLQFAVYNSGGATGLIVSQSGTAVAVPEPGTLMVLASGCVIIGLVGWRRRARPILADGRASVGGAHDPDAAAEYQPVRRLALGERIQHVG